MPVNKKLNVLFIHNPKCGGSSMERFLGMINKNNRLDRRILSGLHSLSNNENVDWKEVAKLNPKQKSAWTRSRTYTKPVQHLTPQELIDQKYITEAEFKKYISFTFIRNPWDKISSSYESYFKKLEPDFDKFLIWVKMMVDYEKEEGKYFIYNEKNRKTLNTHFKEQHKFLSYKGEQIVNFVGRYENIKHDFEEVCKLLKIEYKPLEKINVTAKRKHYSVYYTDEQAALLGEIYKTDIELFNYKFKRIGD